MKKKRTLISLIALALVMVVGIGFATFQNLLSITGTVDVEPNDTAFKVEFIEDVDDHVTLSDDKGTANITVDSSELVKAGDSVTVNLSIQNKSTDKYNATVSAPTISAVSPSEGANASDISVTCSWVEKTLAFGSEAESFTVTITLNKALVEAASYTFSITFDVEAVPA